MSAFVGKPPQTIYQVKELDPLITNIEKFSKNFKNFGNFRGSEISVISGYGFFSQAHENQTNYVSSESAADADQ